MSKQLMDWGQRVQAQLTSLNVKTLGRVGVLMGGRSGEREISLMSGNGVLDALIAKGVDAHSFDTGLRCPTELGKKNLIEYLFLCMAATAKMAPFRDY